MLLEDASSSFHVGKIYFSHSILPGTTFYPVDQPSSVDRIHSYLNFFDHCGCPLWRQAFTIEGTILQFRCNLLPGPSTINKVKIQTANLAETSCFITGLLLISLNMPRIRWLEQMETCRCFFYHKWVILVFSHKKQARSFLEYAAEAAASMDAAVVVAMEIMQITWFKSYLRLK